MRLASVIVSLAGLAVIGAPTASAQQPPCAALLSALQDPSGGLDALQAGLREVEDEPSCTRQERAMAARRAALRFLDGSQAAASFEERKRVLEAGAAIAQPWRLMRALGDAQAEAGDDTRASEAYQSALRDASAPSDEPPSPAEMQAMTRLAQQSRLLAATFVRSVLLSEARMRGLRVESILVPVPFAVGSRRLSPLAERYAEELSLALGRMGHPTILIAGHSDPTGSEPRNRALSAERAAAVADYLKKSGYPAGRIAVSGKGSSEPLKVENGSRYSKAQIYAMLRRVEINVLAPGTGTITKQEPSRE